MSAGSSRSTLERLGILFIVLVVLIVGATLWFVGQGVLQARSAWKGSSSLIAQFNHDICQSAWSSAYAKLDQRYRDSEDLDQFRKAFFADGSTQILRCEGTTSRTARDPGGRGWTAQFYQHLTEDHGSVDNLCVLHSTGAGWTVQSCINAARTTDH